MEYRVKPYMDGWAVYVKKHWYSAFKRYDICYFLQLADAEEFADKLRMEESK